MLTFPFEPLLCRRFYVKRIGLSAYNSEYVPSPTYPNFTAQFTQLVGVTKGIAVYYIHKIAATDSAATVNDTNPSLWNHFLALVDANLASLEFHSYETLQQALINSGVRDDDNSIADSLLAVLRSE